MKLVARHLNLRGWGKGFSIFRLVEEENSTNDQDIFLYFQV